MEHFFILINVKKNLLNIYRINCLVNQFSISYQSDFIKLVNLVDLCRFNLLIEKRALYIKLKKSKSKFIMTYTYTCTYDYKNVINANYIYTLFNAHYFFLYIELYGSIVINDWVQKKFQRGRPRDIWVLRGWLGGGGSQVWFWCVFYKVICERTKFEFSRGIWYPPP